MAQFSRLRVPDASSRAGETSPSPSVAQTTAEFDLDSNCELDDAEGDLQFREAELGGGQAYELKSLVNPAGKKDDGGEDDSFSSRRRMSDSTVSSFQLYTPDEECAVVRKFDRRLVLFVALLFMLSFLDRSSLFTIATPLARLMLIQCRTQISATRALQAWMRIFNRSRLGMDGTNGR